MVTYPAHAPHDAVLLGVDEALEHHADSHVGVVLLDVVSQVHLGVRLGHPNHRLDVADRDRDAASRLSNDVVPLITITYGGDAYKLCL